MEKSPDAFYLMRGKKGTPQAPQDDKEEYTFVIKNIALYVQQGTLSLPLYQEIMRLWPSNDILYHFRRFDVLHIHTSAGSTFLNSDKLWSEAESPG